MTRAPPDEPYAYRRDPAVPAFDDRFPILVFDGKCVLCSRFARFILRNDRAGEIRLLAAQSSLGEALYRHFDLKPADYETNILLVDGRAWRKSDGAIKTFQLLGPPWSALTLARFAPAPMRDWLYDIVARNRLHWFGARETCFVPDPEHAKRFLQ